MINVQELRVGNWIQAPLGEYMQVEQIGYSGHNPDYIFAKSDNGFGQNGFEGIPLTPEILEQCGLGKDTIDNPFFSGFAIQIGRGREISVSNPGTPNEFVFITELNGDKTRTVIVLRNCDYDGKTYLHHLQNIYHSFTLKELTFQPIKELS